MWATGTEAVKFLWYSGVIQSRRSVLRTRLRVTLRWRNPDGNHICARPRNANGNQSSW